MQIESLHSNCSIMYTKATKLNLVLLNAIVQFLTTLTIFFDKISDKKI